MKKTGIINREFQKKLPENILINVRPDEHLQQQLFWYGYYERSVGIMIKKLLKPGCVFLDIGANIGYFALMAGKQCPSCSIVAFEPVREVFEAMKKNILLNDIRNVEIMNVAAGETNEEALLFISADDNLGMSSLKKPENYSGKTQQVKVIRIDDWFAESGLKRIDLVKIDVEGNELAVLNGMKTVIQKFNPFIIMEINPDTLALFYLHPRDIAYLLQDIGYEAKLIEESGTTEEINLQHVSTQINVLLVPAKEKTIPVFLNP